MRSTIVLSLLLVAATAGADPQPIKDRTAATRLDGGAGFDRPRRYFVRLDTPSIAELRARQLSQGGRALSPILQRVRFNQIAREHDVLRARLAPYVERELSSLRVAANGIKVIARPSSVDKIRALRGVQSVAPVSHHELDNTYGARWIQVPKLWENGIDGSGLTIAVIDSGVDYLHANFGGAGSVDAYDSNNKNIVEAGTFPTPKVIGGWDFAGPTYNSRIDEFPKPDPDPLDGNGHGSHVAGTAAGLGVPGVIGPGIAPGANILALKVFSDDSGSTDLTADAIERALDPNQDGVMDDHVDVINMSLGARFGSPDDPSALAASNAAANGIVVVASAGNNGDVPYVTGSPAVSPAAISVAATLAGGRRRLALAVAGVGGTVDGLMAATEGGGRVRIASRTIKAPLVAARSQTPAGGSDNKACAPLTNAAAVGGNVALVARGDCSFEIKYLNVQYAGAAAIVVYNAGGEPDAPFVMGGIGISGKEITIPGLMIGGDDGAELAALLARESVSVVLDAAILIPPPPELADQLTAFTSRGPGHGGATFKPDIAAPGRFITSTAAGTGTQGLTLRGTSMAAPHVAGAALLFKSLYPQRTGADIKALMQNASAPAEFDGPGSDTPVPVSRQGAGVLRLADAAGRASMATPGGLTFGYLNPQAETERVISGAVHNFDEVARQFAVTHESRGTQPGVTVNCPTGVAVDPRATTPFEIGIQIDPGLLPADDGRLSVREVDGWCVFADSRDTLRVAYAALVDPASDVQLIETPDGKALQNFGPARGSAHAFHVVKRGGEKLDGLPNAIDTLGVRATSYLGVNVIDFALVTETVWESAAHLFIEMFVDLEDDGRYDLVLFAGDWSNLGFDPGPFATGYYPLDKKGEPVFDELINDWFADIVDYNDRVLVMPFTNEPGLQASFLPAGVSDFHYRLIVTGRDGSYDEQYGYIDLSEVAGLASESVTIEPGERIPAVSDRDTLYLLPQNQGPTQVTISE